MFRLSSLGQSPLILIFCFSGVSEHNVGTLGVASLLVRLLFAESSWLILNTSHMVGW
jgi:hypothetical protein